MSDPKDFVSGVDSNARKEPRRVVFVTRRTSAQVRVTDEEVVQTFPEVLFRAVVAIDVAGRSTGVDRRCCLTRRWRASRIHRIRPIPPRRRGISSDCRRCCTTFRRWLQA